MPSPGGSQSAGGSQSGQSSSSGSQSGSESGSQSGATVPSGSQAGLPPSRGDGGIGSEQGSQSGGDSSSGSDASDDGDASGAGGEDGLGGQQTAGGASGDGDGDSSAQSGGADSAGGRGGADGTDGEDGTGAEDGLADRGSGDGADGSGEWPEEGAGQAGTSEREGEFERALEEFDQLMGEEQEAIARTGVGSAADRAFEGAGGAGGNTDEVFGLPEGGGSVAAGGTSSEATMPQTAPGEVASEPPPTIEGCEDQDRVARQLCEAATEERDPFLRAALWNEYNEYRKILARQ